MTDEQRDETEYVQGFLDHGALLPAGDYECPGGVTLPGDYVVQVRAATGEEPALTSGPGFLRIADAVIRYGPADRPDAGWLDIVADLETPQDVTVDGRGNLLADCRSEPGDPAHGFWFA
jgi:hypothetical protein